MNYEPKEDARRHINRADTESIVLNGNNLLGAEQAIQTGTEVSQAAVTAFGNVVKT